MASIQSWPEQSATWRFQCTVMAGLASTRSAMALLARSCSPRTIRCTRLPYLVRYTASSQAESPPPTTASSTSRNWGVAPSQMAQALMPAFQKRPSLGSPSRLALAPVARITALARMVWPSAVMRKGRWERSRLSASASTRRVPQRTAWALRRSIRSGPRMPSGKPGKFSTWVVVIS